MEVYKLLAQILIKQTKLDEALELLTDVAQTYENGDIYYWDEDKLLPIISSNIKDFLLKVDPHFRKTQLNIIPFIICQLR